MNKKEKAAKIQKILDDFFPNPPIPLHHTNCYTLLIAVLLSAQCTDARVNLVTPQLFALADNPKDMLKISQPKLEGLIRTCGLAPRKSRAILALSRQLLEKHAGNVPNTFEELEALDGVGHKTASVVMIHCFNQPAFPVDTHIHRCAQRWGLSSGKSVTQTEADLKKVFPQESWEKLHLQIIYFARTYCTARSHNPKQCPICSVLTPFKNFHHKGTENTEK
jgi:endonuclease-3